MENFRTLTLFFDRPDDRFKGGDRLATEKAFEINFKRALMMNFIIAFTFANEN